MDTDIWYIIDDEQFEAMVYASVDSSDLHTIQKYLLTIAHNNTKEESAMQTTLSNIITYKRKKKITINWYDILLFTDDFYKRYQYQIENKEHIYVEHLKSIYLIYFIIVPIVSNRPISFIHNKDTFTISDHHTKENNIDILVTTKYTNQVDVAYDHSIFYNYTIGQFLIHSTTIKDNCMLGKLYPYIIIDKDKIHYKQNVLNLPTSYILKNNILYIKKIVNNKLFLSLQTKKENGSLVSLPYTLSNSEQYIIKHKNSNILFLSISNTGYTLDESMCRSIFNYILYKHQYVNIQHNLYSELRNVFLFNCREKHESFINSSLFSMNFLINRNQIILSYSHVVRKYIHNIISDINAIMTKEYIDNFILYKEANGAPPIENIFTTKNVCTPDLLQPQTIEMDLVECLQRYGFGKIRSCSIHYYTFKNSLYDSSMKQSKKHATQTIQTTPRGYHYIMELYLDIGVNIMIEQTTELRMYISQTKKKQCMDKHLDLHVLQTYSNIQSGMTMSELFIQLYAKNNELHYFTTDKNCAHLQLDIMKILLRNDMNEIIVLENKLKHNFNANYIPISFNYIYKVTHAYYSILPKAIQLRVITLLSSKINHGQLINKNILDNIHQLSLKKRQYIETIPNYCHIGPIFLNHYKYAKNKNTSRTQIKYIITCLLYFIINYIKNNNKHNKDIIHTSTSNKRLQLKYRLTQTEMEYIRILSKKNNISTSDVIRLFLIKMCLLYFTNSYFMIEKQQQTYFIPYIPDDNVLSTLDNTIQLFVKNTSLHHNVYDMVMKRLNIAGYLMNTKEKCIHINEIEFDTDIDIITIDQMYSNTLSNTNPIDMTFVYHQNTYEINVSYNDNYAIIKNMFKEMFTIIEMYALQEE